MNNEVELRWCLKGLHRYAKDRAYCPDCKSNADNRLRDRRNQLARTRVQKAKTKGMLPLF